MSKLPTNGNPEPESDKSGFSLRFTLSEKVIVAILTVATSFLGGMTYGGATNRSNCTSNDSPYIVPSAKDVKPWK